MLTKKAVAVVQLMTYEGWRAEPAAIERDWPGVSEVEIREHLDAECESGLVTRFEDGTYGISEDEFSREAARVLGDIAKEIVGETDPGCLSAILPDPIKET